MHQKVKRKTIPDWVYEEAKKGNYEPFEFHDNELDDDMPYYNDDDDDE